jgi:integrase
MHDLRHTFASYLILELGFDPTRVAEQLGHARASFTLDTYVHLFRQANHAEDIRKKMAESEFGALLGGGGR